MLFRAFFSIFVNQLTISFIRIRSIYLIMDDTVDTFTMVSLTFIDENLNARILPALNINLRLDQFFCIDPRCGSCYDLDWFSRREWSLEHIIGGGESCIMGFPCSVSGRGGGHS
jgi:hypothetical protein